MIIVAKMIIRRVTEMGAFSPGLAKMIITLRRKWGRGTVLLSSEFCRGAFCREVHFWRHNSLFWGVGP
jgi:hypothetical protein